MYYTFDSTDYKSNEAQFDKMKGNCYSFNFFIYISLLICKKSLYFSFKLVCNREKKIISLLTKNLLQKWIQEFKTNIFLIRKVVVISLPTHIKTKFKATRICFWSENNYNK